MSANEVVYEATVPLIPVLHSARAAQVKGVAQFAAAPTGKANMKWQLLKVLYTFITVAIVVSLLLCVYVVRTVPEFNQYRLVRTYPVEAAASAQLPRTILLWNDFFGDARWSLPDDTLGPDHFRDELQCAEYRCELTNDHNFLPAVHLYDAIVFHTAQPFPLLNSVPAERSAKQLYVFALMEPPGETKHVLSDELDFYNITMTYRLDSDIVWPYNYLQDVQSGALVAPASSPAWRQPPAAWNDTAIWQLWPNKTRTAAWFVSRCKTLSQRENLAAALQQHMDVDIYGKCGPLSCKRLSKECDDMLDQKYKFYFAFENSLCTDYVTEKLYNALKRQIIPVVFGGANYARFLPPQSYINAEHYESAEALADYLKYLSAHPEDYMRYFWWRRYYQLGYHSPFCDLCQQLHSVGFQQKQQTYHNIEKWWLSGSCRFESCLKF